MQQFNKNVASSTGCRCIFRDFMCLIPRFRWNVGEQTHEKSRWKEEVVSSVKPQSGYVKAEESQSGQQAQGAGKKICVTVQNQFPLIFCSGMIFQYTLGVKGTICIPSLITPFKERQCNKGTWKKKQHPYMFILQEGHVSFLYKL